MLATTAGATVPAWLMVCGNPCGLFNTNVLVIGLGLGATLTVTVVFPVPEAPETSVTAVGELLVIDHSQPAPTITLNCIVPPVGGTVVLFGLNRL